MHRTNRANSPNKQSSPTKQYPKAKQKTSISPNRHLNPHDPSHHSSPGKSKNNNLQTNKYFCHYENAVYMGGMNCFKKLGHGIMLLDNGACAITCHSHDNMINHNVIFRDGSLTSLIISLNRSKSICIRIGSYLLYFNMTAKDIIQGVGYFINYVPKKLYKLKFQNGKVIVKQRVEDSVILRKVFDENHLIDLIDQPHIKAIQLTFDLPQGMRYFKNNNKLTVAFVGTDGRINGVFFTLFYKQAKIDFDIMLEQRGYMQNGVMKKFGQKHFQNGNYYIGQFKNDKYNGRGVLIYPKEKKWTFGQFSNGEIQKVIDSDVINTSGCPNSIRSIHQFSDSFIKFKIQLKPSEKWILNMLKVINDKDPYQYESIDYTKNEQKKKKNLNIVQSDYTVKRYQNRTQQAIKQLLQGSKEGNLKNENSQQSIMNRVKSQIANRSKTKSKQKNLTTIQKDRLKTQNKFIDGKSKQKKTTQIKKKQPSQSPTVKNQGKLESSQPLKSNSSNRTSPINKIGPAITQSLFPGSAPIENSKEKDKIIPIDQKTSNKQWDIPQKKLSSNYPTHQPPNKNISYSPTKNLDYSPSKTKNYSPNKYLLDGLRANLISPHINPYSSLNDPLLYAYPPYPYLSSYEPVSDITYYPEYRYSPLKRSITSRPESESPYSKYPLAYPKYYKYLDDQDDYFRSGRLSNQRYRNFYS